jgi:hypothetical protein
MVVTVAPRMMRWLPAEKKHDRSKHDRGERCNDGDQRGTRADVDATDAS